MCLTTVEYVSLDESDKEVIAYKVFLKHAGQYYAPYKKTGPYLKSLKYNSMGCSIYYTSEDSYPGGFHAFIGKPNKALVEAIARTVGFTGEQFVVLKVKLENILCKGKQTANSFITSIFPDTNQLQHEYDCIVADKMTLLEEVEPTE